MSLLTLSKLAELKAETEAAQVTTAFLSEYWPIAQAVPCARIKMTALPKHFSYLNNETIFTKNVINLKQQHPKKSAIRNSLELF